MSRRTTVAPIRRAPVSSAHASRAATRARAVVVVDVGPDRLHRPGLLEQDGGGLLADAGDAGQVVAGVAAQGGVLEVVLGRDAVHRVQALRG